MAKSIKQLIRRDIETISAEWIDKQPVLLGDYSGTVQTATPGTFYARQYNGKVIEVYNAANVPPTFDLHVIVGRKKSLPTIWQIIEIRETYGAPAGSGQIGYHHEQHEFPGGDTVWADRKQIVPLTCLVYDAAGFIVLVMGSVVHTATGIHKIANQFVDLSSYVVTAGAKFVSIETDDEGVLSVHAGVAFGAPAVATDADIPVPDPGKYLIAFVLFYEGQTALSNEDIRVPFPLGIVQKNAALQIHDSVEVKYLHERDEIGLWQTAQGLMRKIKWGSVKHLLRDYFNKFYATVAHTHPELETSEPAPVGSGSPMEDQIDAATQDDTPANGDMFGYRDAITGLLKKIPWAEIINTLGVAFDSIYSALGHSHAAIYPPGHLFGCTISNDPTDPTNDIGITAGQWRSDDNTENMDLASALIKRLDAAWAVGTNQGMLDTGSIANTTYHIFLIKRTDTNVVDILASTSATSPTMPTDYTKKRRIGSIVRLAGVIKPFIQDGDRFGWKAPVLDVNVTNPGTSAATRTLTVPTGIRVEAIMSVLAWGNSGSSDNPAGIYISDLSADDVAASTSNYVTYSWASGAFLLITGSQARVMTNTSAQVRSRLELSTANTIFRITAQGWVDTRGRLS